MSIRSTKALHSLCGKINCNISDLFFRYCTETLALLPFTLPDEPLYLVYSINRVVQIRAGAIESNLKALLHKDSAKTHHGNGTYQQDPIPSHMHMMDLNTRIQEPTDWNSYGHPTPFDLNGAGYQDPRDQFSLYQTHNGEANVPKMTSSDPPELSTNDLQKIQVVSISFSPVMPRVLKSGSFLFEFSFFRSRVLITIVNQILHILGWYTLVSICNQLYTMLFQFCFSFVLFIGVWFLSDGFSFTNGLFKLSTLFYHNSCYIWRFLLMPVFF